jgi:hypothetical protein
VWQYPLGGREKSMAKKAGSAKTRKTSAKAAPKTAAKKPVKKAAKPAEKTAPHSDPGPQSVLDGPMKSLFRAAFLRRGG